MNIRRNEIRQFFFCNNDARLHVCKVNNARNSLTQDIKSCQFPVRVRTEFGDDFLARTHLHDLGKKARKKAIRDIKDQKRQNRYLQAIATQV